MLSRVLVVLSLLLGGCSWLDKPAPPACQGDPLKIPCSCMNPRSVQCPPIPMDTKERDAGTDATVDLSSLSTTTNGSILMCCTEGGKMAWEEVGQRWLVRIHPNGRMEINASGVPGRLLMPIVLAYWYGWVQ